MLYILVCIVTILLLLPCVYSLPGFVYGRPASKLKFFRHMPPLWFWLLFAFGLAFYFAFFLTLLKSIAPLTARSVRLLIGCSIVFICAESEFVGNYAWNIPFRFNLNRSLLIFFHISVGNRFQGGSSVAFVHTFNNQFAA